MRKRPSLAAGVTWITGAAIAAAISLPALANEGGEAATFLGLPRWVWLWLNLLLFLGILGYFIVPGIRRFLDGRNSDTARVTGPDLDTPAPGDGRSC